MRLLLDTHSLIWWWMDDPFLPERAKTVLADPANDVFVSAATGWEIATKVRNGQLAGIRDRMTTYVNDVEQDGFRHLAITARHGIHGGSLPGAHQDPFDRIIAAQALLDDLTVVTRDPEIAKFGCEVLW